MCLRDFGAVKFSVIGDESGMDQVSENPGGGDL